jgi:small subunit ribosomal protein S20
MPITASAKKALRGSARKKAVNDRRKKAMKDSFKDIEKLIKAKSLAEAKKLVSKAEAAIDKAAKKGVIKKNTAARKKSRLSRMTKAK